MPSPPGRTHLPHREVGELGGAQEVTRFLGVLMASDGHGDSEGILDAPAVNFFDGHRAPIRWRPRHPTHRPQCKPGMCPAPSCRGRRIFIGWDVVTRHGNFFAR